MNEFAEKRIKSNIKAINREFDYILKRYDHLENERIKLEFEGIRDLVNACEEYALEGKKAN
jgi:hypothetical protein